MTEPTPAQRSFITDCQTLHEGVRWAFVARSPHHEELEGHQPPILVQWRYHQAIRSRMVFADGHTGPIGESVVYV